MSSTPQPIRGTQSLIGEEADRFHEVVAAFDRVRRLYGFKRVEVPIIENTAVFARTMGETTDVVSKEMYTFFDKSDDSITLRPEFTAGIARAFLSEGWKQHIPLKVATHGAAFRYERPQKGRFRQFHQLDAEIIGPAEPQADVELLAFGADLLRMLRIREVTLKLNTLGDTQSREAWRSRLIEYFEDHRDSLSEDCQSRLAQNPLRILDSKDARDRAVAANAPIIDEFLTPQADEFLAEVEAGLNAAGVPYVRDHHLVRGLDYYRHTAFEFVTDQLGAQGAVIAGGRYDGLIEQLGGPHTPATGWAAGIERLAMLIDAPEPEALQLILIPDDESDLDVATRLLRILRANDIAADMAFSGSSKKRYEKARKGVAHRALTVTSWDVDAYAVVRLRNLKEGAPTIRGRLREVLEKYFVVHEDEHRAFTLTEKP